jgi:glycosyltransferase involved in cell wall biosynthesis
LGPVGDNTQTEFTIGTKVAEAAYLHKPIVVGDQPAINEVFDHRESAYLVEPGDPEALADGIEAVLGDDDLRTRLADGAHRVYGEHFSTESAGRQLVGIIEDAD